MTTLESFTVVVVSLFFLLMSSYLGNKLFDLLNGHLERLQGKLDVLQVQQSETNELLESLIRKLS